MRSVANKFRRYGIKPGGFGATRPAQTGQPGVPHARHSPGIVSAAIQSISKGSVGIPNSLKKLLCFSAGALISFCNSVI